MDWRDEYHAQLVGNHLTVERLDGAPIVAEWDVLQAIKNEMCGEEIIAIEIFPAESQKVNEINRRHLWIVSESDIYPFNLSYR